MIKELLRQDYIVNRAETLDYNVKKVVRTKSATTDHANGKICLITGATESTNNSAKKDVCQGQKLPSVLIF